MANLLGRLDAQLADRGSVLSRHRVLARPVVRPTRLQVALWVAVLFGALLIALSNYHSFQLGVYNDDSHYVILAQSIVSSPVYGLIYGAGQPRPADFPFGFPLLLAPMAAMFPTTFDMYKVVSLVFTLLNMALLFWTWPWLTHHASYWLGLAVTALYALSPLVVEHTRMVMSEPAFMAFCLVSIILTERVAQGQPRWWSSSLMSVALTFAVVTRAIGMTLVVCVFAYLLLRMRLDAWKFIVLVIVQSALLLLVIQATTPIRLSSLLPTRYVSQVKGPTNDVQGAQTKLLGYSDYRIKEYFGNALRQALLPLGGGDSEQRLAAAVGLQFPPQVVGFLAFGIILLGYGAWLARQGLTVFQLFAVCYQAVLFFWIWQGPRLLYPIQPQLYLGLLLGMSVLVFWALRPLRRLGVAKNAAPAVFAVIAVLLLCGNIYKSLRIENTRQHVGDLEGRAAWVQSNTPPSAIVMTEEPEIDYLNAGRKTVPYPRVAPPVDLEEYLASSHTDYILVAASTEWQDAAYTPTYSAKTRALLPGLDDLVRKTRLTRVYADDTALVQVFKVNP